MCVCVVSIKGVLTLNLPADADAAQDMTVIYLAGFELSRQRMSHVMEDNTALKMVKRNGKSQKDRGER